MQTPQISFLIFLGLANLAQMTPIQIRILTVNSEKLFFPENPLEISDFSALNDLWEKGKYNEIHFPSQLSLENIKLYYEYLIERKTLNLAVALLSELAEQKNLSRYLAKEIFFTGDVASQCAICMRSDLPDEILSECLKSNDARVLSALIFNTKVSIDMCRKLYENTEDEALLRALNRAIKVKQSS